MHEYSTTKNCPHCGKEIVTRDPRQRYCSRSCGRKAPRIRDMAAEFWAKIARGAPDECWPFLGYTNEHGYGKFGWRYRQHYAHRVAWELTHGPIPPGHSICHRCDNTACCNPAHLFVGLPADNTHDMIAKGRHAHGDRHWSAMRPEARMFGTLNPQAKLTDDDVRAIRARYAEGGISYRALGAEYGIKASSIALVVTRQRWSHID